MLNLPGSAWIRFAVWLVAGLLIYTLYGYRHSLIRRNAGPAPRAD
jgi:APA family basic amino acid/polyamine antiporter